MVQNRIEKIINVGVLTYVLAVVDVRLFFDSMQSSNDMNRLIISSYWKIAHSQRS